MFLPHEYSKHGGYDGNRRFRMGISDCSEARIWIGMIGAETASDAKPLKGFHEDPVTRTAGLHSFLTQHERSEGTTCYLEIFEKKGVVCGTLAGFVSKPCAVRWGFAAHQGQPIILSRILQGG